MDLRDESRFAWKKEKGYEHVGKTSIKASSTTRRKKQQRVQELKNQNNTRSSIKDGTSSTHPQDSSQLDSSQDSTQQDSTLEASQQGAIQPCSLQTSSPPSSSILKAVLKRVDKVSKRKSKATNNLLSGNQTRKPLADLDHNICPTPLSSSSGRPIKSPRRYDQ
jgi:hypothetical protein